MKRTALALILVSALLFSAVAGAVEVLFATENSWTAKAPATHRIIEGEIA